MEVSNMAIGAYGRPIKDIQIRIRMTESEAELLAQCAKVLGKSKTAIVNDGIRMIANKLPESPNKKE
jgi:hypothetical protein